MISTMFTRALLLLPLLAAVSSLAAEKPEAVPALKYEPQILVKLETFTLPKNSAQLLLMNGMKDSPLHAALRKMIADKTATMAYLMIARGCEGQCVKLEQIDEFPYPTDIDPEQIPQYLTLINPRALGLPVSPSPAPLPGPVQNAHPVPVTNAGIGMMSIMMPTTFNVRNLGESLEIETEVDWKNQRINLNIAPESVHFASLIRKNSADQPEFETQKLNTRVSLASGAPCFVGTLSKSVATGTLNANQDDSLSLAFVTATLDMPPPAHQQLKPDATPRYQWELISLPKETAIGLLEEPVDDHALHEKLRQMIKTQAAKLESVQLLRTASDARAKASETDDLPYPTDFNPPQMPGSLTIADQRLLDILEDEGGRDAPAPDTELDPANGGFGLMTHAMPTTFATRFAGAAFEIDPVLRDNRTSLRVKIAAERTRFLGLKRYEDAHQPLFESQTINTAVNISFNQPLLVGTMSRPIGTGVEGGNTEDRIWLAFLTVVVPKDDLTPVSERSTMQLLLKDEWFTLRKDELRSLLVAGMSDSNLRLEIKKRVQQNTATQDRLMLIRTRSGQRTKVEQIDEFAYAADFDPGQVSQQLAILDANTIAQAMKLPPPLLPAAMDRPEPAKQPGSTVNGGIGLQNTVTGTTFQVRYLGDTLEIDPVIGEDNKTIDLNLASEQVQFSRYVDYADIAQPVFQTRKINSALTAQSGQTIIAGTCSKASNTGREGSSEDDSVTISFLTPKITALPKPKGMDNPWSPPAPHPVTKSSLSTKPKRNDSAEPNPADPFAEPDPEGPKPPEPLPQTESNMRCQFELISLPTSAAAALLDEDLDDAALHERLKGMIIQDSAQLEKLLSLRTVSGQRAKLEQVAETPYATDYDPPQIPQKLAIADPKLTEILRKGGATATQAANRPLLATPNSGFGFITGLSATTYQVRNVGETVEIDPVLAEDGMTVDLNIAPESLRLVGETTYAEGTQPVFETQKLNTAVTTRIGQPCLLGTMSKPINTGAPGGNKIDRVWLAFITVFRD